MKNLCLIICLLLIGLISSFTCGACASSITNKQILDIRPNERNEYVIRKSYDLNGETITIPESSKLIFKGGSINNGTIILSSGCKVVGKNAHLKAHCTKEGKQIGHQALIMAESAENITIEDIVLEGCYDETMGHLNPWTDKSEASQSLLFLRDCHNIIINNVTVRNFYNSMSTHYSSWDSTYKSEWNPFPVNIYGCRDIQIHNCKHLKSCGEAWNIMNCSHVDIDKFSCKQKYATSVLSIIYCKEVTMQNCHIEAERSLGNLVNIASKDYVIENNYISGGDLDFGNEHANVDIDLDNDGIVGDNKKYSIVGAVIKNNTIKNASITNNTVKQAGTDYPIENLSISGNHIIINVSTQESLRAINLGSFGGIRKCEITENEIIYKGKYNTSFADNQNYRYIPIVAYRKDFPVDSLLIKGNVITDRARWDKDKSKTMEMTKTLGSAILVNLSSGEIIVEGNDIKALYGITVIEKPRVKIEKRNNILKQK